MTWGSVSSSDLTDWNDGKEGRENTMLSGAS